MRKNKAFTLIEIVAVFTVMIIIVSISTISISSTLRKNTIKTNEVKKQNILKAAEDYIVKNKLKVSASAPLYFSVAALAADNILSDDANQTIASLEEVEGPFIIKASKDINSINFEFLPVSTVLGDNAILNYNESVVNTWGLAIENNDNLIIKEQQNKTIKFSLTEINDHNAIKNLHIKKAELIIKKLVDGTFTNFSVRTIKDLRVTADGKYYFTFVNNLAPSTKLYRFNIRVTTETGAILMSEDDVNLPILRGITKPLYTYVNSPVNWSKTNVNLVVYGQQYGTSIKADEITYSGRRYTTGVTTGAYVDVPLTTVIPNPITGEATISLTGEGIYVLDFESKITEENISSAMPTTVTVKIDKTVPGCTSAGGSATWYNTNRTITGTCSDPNGSGCTGNVSTIYSTTTNGSYSPGTVYDLANNSRTCPVQTVKVDKINPTCTSSGGSTSWFSTNRTITGTCTDAGSGCIANVSQTYSADTNTNYSPGTIGDTAGNTTVCPVQTVKIDKTAPVVTFTPNASNSDASPKCAGTDNSVDTPVTISISDGGSGVAYSQWRIFDDRSDDTTNSWSSWTSAGAATSYSLTIHAPGRRVFQVYTYDYLSQVVTYQSGEYYLDGPIVSITSSSRSLPTSSLVTIYYKCDAYKNIEKRCDSKLSTSVGSTNTYANLDANIDDNNNSNIYKHTTITPDSSYQYFWVRSSTDYCATSTKGYRIRKVYP